MTVSPQRPTFKKIERLVDGYWDDISVYVTSEVLIKTGIFSYKFDNRTASPGMIEFTVHNYTNHFTVDSFPRGMKIRVTVAWGTFLKTWIGYVITSNPPVGTVGAKFMHIKCQDWMGVAAEQPIKALTPVEVDKRADEAIPVILAGLEVAPQNQIIYRGTQTFGLVHDAIKSGRTTIYAELDHYAKSELGYVYIRNGETLVFENLDTRGSSLRVQSVAFGYNKPTDKTYLVKADADEFITTPDGYRILLDVRTTDTFNGIMEWFVEDPELSTGDNVVNEITFNVYPRFYDPDPLTGFDQLYTYNLYTASPPIPIAPGEEVTLHGRYYVDQRVSDSQTVAKDVGLAPYYPIDVSFNANPDGSGASLLGSLDATFTAGGDSWKYRARNTGVVIGYITYIELGGIPINATDPLDWTMEDADSKRLYTPKTMTISQNYQQDLTQARSFAPTVLEDNRISRTLLEKIAMCANIDAHEMAGFMSIDIGTLIRVKLVNPALDLDYVVQGEEIHIRQDGIIFYQCWLQEHPHIEIS